MIDFEGEEQIESDVSSEPSSEAPESATNSSPEKPETSTQTDTQHSGPFHTHPRWIERDNELKAEREARQELDKRYKELDARFQQFSAPKPAAPADKYAALKERLKGIDPEFASFLDEFAPKQSIEDLRAAEQTRELNALKRTADETIARLHTENKISPELQSRYQRDIEAKIRMNPNVRLDELPRIYKEVHEDNTKFLESIRRAEREAYLATKKADAKTPPSQPAGKKAGTSNSEFTGNKEQDRATLIKSVLKQTKASESL